MADVIQMGSKLLRHWNVVIAAPSAVHRTRQLTGVGHHVIVQKSKVLLAVHALEHAAHCSSHGVVARGNALRAYPVVAFVETFADCLAAFGLGGRQVVENQLSEQIG